MTPAAAPILLKTKLHRYPLQTDFVLRPHLLHKLQQGLRSKLTLVVAPAGFGKSTLVASWLATLEQNAKGTDSQVIRTCWLSLDAQDSNVGRFLNYFLAALHTAYPAACPTLSQVLQSLPLPATGYLADLLTAELSELTDPLVFVLDDFHHIQGVDVAEIVEKLLAHAPPALHMVIVSRLDPSLPLARLRVQNQISEVRAADLRFSVSEAEEFFDHALSTALSPELVRKLDERAEGWVAGLRLAALSLQDRPDPDALVAEFSGTQRHVMDFLLEQVLAQQPPDVVRFLLYTSPLEMMCAPLCNEILNATSQAHPIDSQAVLTYLARSNLFLVALDSKGYWYRYHHLFREALLYWLKTQHPDGVVTDIQRQAAAWFARNGHLEPAVRQLLEIEAVDEAGNLIEVAIAPALGRETWPQVQQLLAALPEEVISQRPVLLMAQAWLLSVMQRMDLVPNLLQQAEILLRQQREEGRWSESPPWMEGWIHGLWCLVHLLRWDTAAAISAAQQALALTPANHVYVRGITTVYYALALRYTGRYDEALALCAQVLAGTEEEETRHRVLSALGMLATYEGDLHGLAAAGERNLRAGGAGKVSRPHAWGHLFLGVAAYEQNDLEAAQRHFLAAYTDRFGGATVLSIDSCYGLAVTSLALGDRSGAQEWAEKMAQVAQEAENVYLMATAQWFACRLALSTGTVPPLPSAHLWCLGKAPSFQYRWAEFPDITYARLLIAQGSRADLAEVVEVMQRLADFSKQHSMHWRQIEALAVLALAQAAQGHEAAALATLTVAVERAQTQSFVRTFVDLGPQMANLLYKLAQNGVAAEYTGRLLRTFPLAARNNLAVTTAAQRDDEIIDPLSERELEVLSLLAERLSDKEIAQRLRISPLTVRRHSVNLYQKLHVNSRRQAVSRGQALGLLRPTP